jgi:hypothetical protein
MTCICHISLSNIQVIMLPIRNVQLDTFLHVFFRLGNTSTENVIVCLTNVTVLKTALSFERIKNDIDKNSNYLYKPSCLIC